LNKDIILEDGKRICECVNLDCLSDSTVLVTGASGLIGTYFISSLRWLVEQGMNITVYALINSEPPQHLSQLVRNSGFELIEIDLADFTEYSRLPEADVIIHAAGYAQPIRFMNDPISTLQINTSATAALLMRLRNNGNFLFLSSSEVYSGLKNPPFSETVVGTTTPLHPRSSYIEGKRGGESICFAYRSNGVNAISIRLGDIYGPGTRKHDNRAINSFIERALSSQKIELLDSGSSIRTFLYVSDAVELMWKILMYGEKPLYNLGGYSTLNIAELAKLIAQIIDVPIVIPSDKNGVSGAPKDLRLDLTRVETEFVKTKYVSLEEGLRETIEWQKSLYSN
jgi:nucleoside-diphosphate-sugar epimerase